MAAQKGPPCRICSRQLVYKRGQRDKATYHTIVYDRDDHPHKVHQQCVSEALKDGYRLEPRDPSKKVQDAGQ